MLHEIPSYPFCRYLCTFSASQLGTGTVRQIPGHKVRCNYFSTGLSPTIDQISGQVVDRD